MITLKIKQAKTLCKDFLAYRKHQNKTPNTSNKNVLINFKNPQLYHRFFYTLLKFYSLAGYNVHFPMSFSTYRNLRNKDRYLALLVEDENTILINPQNLPEKYIEINDDMFSEEYFKSYFEENNVVENSFHVPMSFHPNMYHLGFWNSAVQYKEKRHNALFCFGNFDETEYQQIKNTHFKSLSRPELHSFFKKQPGYISLNHKKELEEENLDFNKKFVFAFKENYQIKMQDLRSHLSMFDFFLCCSGVVKPICHNVIEAMSVGSIPIIEKEYAEVLYPNLEHKKNAIIFENLTHLSTILNEELFQMSQDEIAQMRKNVFEYYQDFLSPKGMIKNLNDHLLQKHKIFLQAGPRSVKFKTQER